MGCGASAVAPIQGGPVPSNGQTPRSAWQLRYQRPAAGAVRAAALLAAGPAIEAAMDVCGGCFGAWAAERVAGVFNASAAASSERGAKAYNCMGHGWPNNTNFAVIVALRELLQNAYDAGATAVEARSCRTGYLSNEVLS